MENKIIDALDIWSIINKYIDFGVKSAVLGVDLHIDMVNESSIIKVEYYPWKVITNRRMAFYEETFHSQFELGSDDTDRLYREICDLVEMPKSVSTLSTHLSHEEVVEFELKMNPLQKVLKKEGTYDEE